MAGGREVSLDDLRRVACPEDFTSTPTTPGPNASGYQGDSWGGGLSELYVSTANHTLIDNVSAVQYDEYQSKDETQLQHFENILYSKVIVSMCVLGVVGNFINLIVLVPKGFQKSMGRIERFSYRGMVALAASDLLFCVTGASHLFVSFESTYNLFASVTFGLVYTTYNTAFLNVFMLCSTWITVALAIGRYLVVCFPIQARLIIGRASSSAVYIIIALCCIIFNLPRFWIYKIVHIQCAEGHGFYFRFYGPLANDMIFKTVYSWFYFVFGITAPLVILMFTSTNLVRALRRAHTKRMSMRASDTQQGVSRHITLTLITIIIFYIVLVTPAEFINFLRGKIVVRDAYNFAVAIVNTLQAVNFAVNFVLYCVINVAFRRALLQMFRCSKPPELVLGAAQKSRMVSVSMAAHDTEVTRLSNNGNHVGTSV